VLLDKDHASDEESFGVALTDSDVVDEDGGGLGGRDHSDFVEHIGLLNEVEEVLPADNIGILLGAQFLNLLDDLGRKIYFVLL
jgi:hypothetical protein